MKGSKGRTGQQLSRSSGLALTAVGGLGLMAAWGLMLTACGGHDATPSGRSMAAPAAPVAGRSNEPPEVTHIAFEPRSPQPGQDLAARVEASDPDGDAVHMRFAWRLDGHSLPERGATVHVPEGAHKGQRVELQVVASDGQLEAEPVVAETRVANRPPALFAVRLEPADGVRRGKPVVAVVDARDPDDDALRLHYEWRVNDRPAGEDEGRLATDGLKRGDRIQVQVVASDGEDETPPMNSPPIPVGNTAPEITSNPGTTTSEGVFRYAVEATDADGDRNLRFRLAEAPPGATIDPVLGQFEWKAQPDQVGVHPIEVVVEDGHGGETHQRFEITVRQVEQAGAKTADGASEQPPAALE